MDKEVIEVYADPELKRRVEEAAAKYNMPVAEYCLDAIEQKLADDVVLGEAGMESGSKLKKLDAKLLDEIARPA